MKMDDKMMKSEGKEMDPRMKANRELLCQLKKVAEEMMLEDMEGMKEEGEEGPKAMMAMLKLKKDEHEMPDGEMMSDEEMPEGDEDSEIAELEAKLAALKAKKKLA